MISKGRYLKSSVSSQILYLGFSFFSIHQQDNCISIADKSYSGNQIGA